MIKRNKAVKDTAAAAAAEGEVQDPAESRLETGVAEIFVEILSRTMMCACACACVCVRVLQEVFIEILSSRV